MPYIDETIAAEENDPKVHNGTDIYPNILADVEAAIEGIARKTDRSGTSYENSGKSVKG